MTIAFDAETEGNFGTINTTFTVNHTPVGTPAAVFAIVTSQDTSDLTTGATYGGETMTKVGAAALATGETGTAVLFELLSPATIPTGAQDCVVTPSGFITTPHLVVITATADGDVVRQDFDNTIASDAQASPVTVTLSLGGNSCFCFVGFICGRAGDVNTSPLTDWTQRAFFDLPTSMTSKVMTYDTIGTSDVTAGYTADSTDDAVMVAAAYYDDSGGGVVIPRQDLDGMARPPGGGLSGGLVR